MQTLSRKQQYRKTVTTLFASGCVEAEELTSNAGAIAYARSQGISYKEFICELEKDGLSVSLSVLRRYQEKQDATTDTLSVSDSSSHAKVPASDQEEIIPFEKVILERFDNGNGVLSVMTTKLMTLSD